jgi:ligand-binding sensor domain-containing protein
MKPTLLLLFFLLAIAGIATGQNPHFEQYFLGRRNESIPVNKIFQSREGYIWIATSTGLYRYDGVQYKTYGLADSLPDLGITALAQDSLGRIWTAHSSGKLAYLSNGKFKAFEPAEGLSPAPVSDLIFDTEGVLWFSTLNDGLYYFKNERLYRLDEENGMPDLYVYDIALGDNQIFAGTDGGMVICKLKGTSAAIDVIDHKDGLPDNIVRKIYSLTSNTVLLGTEDQGVMLYDLKQKSFKPITSPFNLKSVSDIIVKSDRAWISSSQSGLVVADLVTGASRHYNEIEGKRLPVISALCIDLELNIWAGSRNGIFRTLGDELEFLKDAAMDGDAGVMAVAADQHGAIWFSTQQGLFKRTQTPAGDYRTTRMLSATPYHRARVISLFVDSKGFIWAGLYGEGVLRVDPLTHKTILLSKELRNGNVLNISGKDNTVWLATLGGAERIDISEPRLKITHYSVDNGLSSDFVYQVYVDADKRAWLATDGKGLDMIDNTGVHHHESGLTSKVVYGVAEDSGGRIWVNTQDAGIFYFDGKNFIEARKDSIAFRATNNVVLSSDRGGRIIAMHNGGIDIYDPASKQIQYLDEQAGLENRIANLNAVTRDGAGNLLLGTSNGIVMLRYDPHSALFPKVHVAGVTLVGKKEVLDVTQALSYNQNNLNISFRGFWYQNPRAVSFMYKMDNYDEEWIVTRENNITYSQLPPGEYTFRVRSAQSPLTEESIHFVINPPFWRTGAFIAAALVMAAAAIFGYIKYREKALKHAKEILELKVEERTLEIQRNSEEIQAQNEEIMAQAEEIKGINENLEMLVHQRTAELEKKNRALEEYAFINAHKLRSPVASILGLVNLLNKAELNDECKVINRHLLSSADELDEIVRSITKAIERGER